MRTSLVRGIHRCLAALGVLALAFGMADARAATVTVTVAPTPVGGRVTSSPGSLNCGGNPSPGVACSGSFTVGATVTLTAAADAGYVFDSWTVTINGTPATSTVNPLSQAVPPAPVTVAANFLPLYPLTVSVAGSTGSGGVSTPSVGTQGAIACGTDIFFGLVCSSSYASGRSVVLTAAAGVGSTFSGWGNACAAWGTGPTCTLTMDAAKPVTATFALQQFTLLVSKGGTGFGTVTTSPAAGIDCGIDCAETYNFGASVTLTALPSPGSTFAGWSNACTGTGTCTVTMDAAKSATATFTLQQFTLSVGRDGIGSGTVTTAPAAGIDCGADCSEIYSYGTSVTLTAVPSPGSTFVGWGGNCAGPGLACTLTMDGHKGVMANFQLQQFTLSVARSGNGSGSVTTSPAAGIDCGADCSQVYNFGTLVTLSAPPTAGSTFTGWSGACTGTGSCVVTMDAAKSVTAAFALQQFTLSVGRAGNGAGTVTTVLPATGIDCGADCSEAYDFGASVSSRPRRPRDRFSRAGAAPAPGRARAS